MRYLEFLFGQTVNFAVAQRTSPQQITDRLRPEVRSRFWPFHFEKVVGRVGADTLSLEWRGGIFGTNMAPRLKGRLVSAGGSTRFEGRFGAPVSLRFFLGMWVCFDGMFFVLALSGKLEGGDTPSWVVFPFLTLHLFAPFGISALGMVGADKIRQRLIDFVVNTGSGNTDPTA